MKNYLSKDGLTHFIHVLKGQFAKYLPLSGGTMSGDIKMGTHKVSGLATPTENTDAATKAYVDGHTAPSSSSAAKLSPGANINGQLFDGTKAITVADGTKLPLAGGTMTGAIAMGTKKITGLGAPTEAADAATKSYVDSHVPATADKLTTARTITLSTDATGSVNFDGSGNVTLPVTLKNVATATSAGPTAAASPGFGGKFQVPRVTINAKGLTTAVAGYDITLPAAPTSVANCTGDARSAKTAKVVTLTLNATAWTSDLTLRIAAAGVVASETAQLVIPAPAMASMTAYYDAQILCTKQEAGYLTFKAKTKPSANLTVYVSLFNIAA